MESLAPTRSGLAAQSAPAVRGLSLPWPVAALLLGSTSIVIGLLWDISWHMTIGRDTFWTPAHMAVYLGGVLAGLSGGWLALHTTFAGSAAERAAAVHFWGFRAPLGAWVAVWGTIAMLTSAPFDDWWHNAYGLDVKIISPPHMVLAAGMIAIQLGAMLLVLAPGNRAEAGADRGLGRAFLYAAGLVLMMLAAVLMEDSFPNDQHSAHFYKASCLVYPLLLAAVARASRLRWAAVKTALVYSVLQLGLVWVLPLFPAQPKLAPINNPLDHMAAPLFPLLLVIPAAALDWAVQKTGKRSRWFLAPVLATLFLGLFLPVQWNVSRFLISPAARNAFFASDRHWDYSRAPGEWMTRYWQRKPHLTAESAAAAWAIAALSAQAGLGLGAWMARVRR